MKKKSYAEATRFPFKFKPVMIFLCIAGLAVSVAGIAITIFRMIKNDGIKQFNDVLKYPFLIAVCLACIVLIVAVLIKSQYVVTKEYFITQFGFIKSKYPIGDFTSLTLDRSEHKLTVHAGESFMVVSVSPAWQDEFCSLLIKTNPNIEFSYTLTEVKQADKPNDKKKK